MLPVNANMGGIYFMWKTILQYNTPKTRLKSSISLGLDWLLSYVQHICSTLYIDGNHSDLEI